MELFATLLCMCSMFAGFIFIIMLIVNKIRKKPKKKLYSKGLLISVVVFVVSIVLFAVFETPESRAKYEQQRLEEQKEQEKEEQAKKEQTEKEQSEKDEKKKPEKKEEEEKKKTEEKPKKEESTKQTKESTVSEDKTTKDSTEEAIKEKIIKVVGEENLETFNYVPDNNFALIKFKGSENLTSKMTVEGMYMDIANILKGIQEDIDVNVDINVTYPLQDSYGNIEEDIVIKATFNNETIKKINFDNFLSKNIPSIADEWWNHQALTY